MLANVSKKLYFFKFVSVVLTLTFFSMTSAFAIPEKDIITPAGDNAEKLLSVEDIGIAIDCGSIKSKYNGGNRKFIIHIQDAHCNYEAQSNINKILDQVTKECGINMISVEGAEGIVDTAWFRAFPDAEIRKEVANYFMKKGEITGAEFFSINSDYSGTIFGAETRDYYIKNLKSFTEVYPYKNSIEKYLKNLETIANRLKTVVYSPELKELDLKIRNFDSKELELSDFSSYLSKAAAKNNVSIKEHKDFKKLLQTLEYEKKIDFDIVDKERSDYIDALNKKLEKEEMADLVAESIKFKKGHIKAVDFYTYLREMAKEQEIDIIHEYPNLFYYYIYTKLYEGINNENLFKNIDKIQTALKGKLFKNDTQKRLDKYSEMVNMFVNLVNIELTNDDYDTFKRYRSDFALEEVLRFFSNLSDRYGLGYTIDPLPSQISNNLPNMINFYEIAMKRDKALIDNTLERMQKEGKDRCVLIAGGFHTRGIKDLLEKQGVSYVVVTPKITKDVETPYIKVLTNQRTSLEDIITESAAMPGINVNNNRADAVTAPEGKMLAPLSKIFYTINLYLERSATLEEISDAIGEVNGETIKAAAEETYQDMVKELVEKWIEKQSPEKNEAVTQEVWNELKNNWRSLSGAMQLKMEKLDDKDVKDNIVKSIISAFEKIFSSPGNSAVRLVGDFDSYEQMTKEETEGMDAVIASLMETGRYNEPEKISVSDVGGGKATTMEIVPLVGFREAIEQYNIKTGLRIPLDVMVHPGTGKGKYTRMYLDARMFEALSNAQIERLALHEYQHILDPVKSETDVITRLDDDLQDVRDIFTKVENDRLAERAAINKNLLKHSQAMSTAASSGVGPEVVIIVTTSRAEAEFWQSRLTGEDNRHGAGTVVKKDAIVLAITEENWEKGAGNGLGTLNGYVQAARKAADFGLLGEIQSDADIEELVPAFMDYCKDKTSFMYHTAGKGTRTAPIPGAEINSKPNIKLPRVLDMRGDLQPITILESVLMQTGIYAASRKNRMGVFWGDQVIVNENDVAFNRDHHVEIFGQLVPLDEDIKAYGVLLPGDNGDCKQREKLPLEEVLNLLPEGEENAYKSIGSFTVSLSFLNALINTEVDTLKEGKGSLDTDPHWWQPLTSTRDEYIEMMLKKGKDQEASGAQWDKMDKMWEDFIASDAFRESGYNRKVGFTDVGKNSYWWDYGQNKFFLSNMQLLTRHDPQGRAARRFFNITRPLAQDEDRIVRDFKETDNWVWTNKSKEVKKVLIQKLAESMSVKAVDLTVSDFYTPVDVFGGKDLRGLVACAKRTMGAESEEEGLKLFMRSVGIDAKGWISDDSVVSGDVDITNSVIQNSVIKSGSLKNCVVINSTLTHVDAEDAVIIGSVIISLKNTGGMVYNVVQERASLKPGQILVNVFHPEAGRIEMRTTASRDGEWDFKKGPDGETGAFVFDNRYKYAELHALNQGVSIADVTNKKQNYIAALMKREEFVVGSTKLANYQRRAEILSEKRGISLPEARQIIAHRLLGFGDVEYFTVKSYANMFTTNINTAKTELEALAERFNEKVTEKGEREGLPGIYKIRDIVFSEEKSDYIEAGEAKYTAIPYYNREEHIAKMRELAFGTSGLRSVVKDMTDMEVYLNTRGYIKFLESEEGLADGDIVTIAGDFRGSTPRIMSAVAKAVQDESKAMGKNIKLDFAGQVASPAGAYRGRTRGSFVIVVTGSHIPFYMNGIKYYMKNGEEVLKKHEAPILAAVKKAREEEANRSWEESLFDFDGMFKEKQAYKIDENEDEVRKEYRDRYLDNFAKDKLKGENIVFWKHSAVGADDVDIILSELGVNVISEEQDKKVFVPVDTEKVKPEMAEKLEVFVQKHKDKSPAGVIFTDGDSDRPGVADENGQFLTGDKLGLLVTKFLNMEIKPDEQMIVALPVSTNIGVVRELEDMGIKVIRTQIGSPHVVKAMNDAEAIARKEGKTVRLLGWEANGGFLLGRDFKVPGGGVLTRLATRDAVLPILAALYLAKEKNMKLSELFAAEIPAVYNHTGGYERFKEDFRLERDEAMVVRKGIIDMLKPSLQDTDVVAINFDTMNVEKRVTTEINGETVLTFERSKLDASEISEKDMQEWMRVKDLLESVFTAESFGNIIGVDIMDGIQVLFDNGEISHIRPSGNDPVFRNYAMTPASMDRAKEIAFIGETFIIPGLAEKVIKNMKSPGSQAVRTRKISKAHILEDVFAKYNETAASKISRDDFDKVIAEIDKRIKNKEVLPVKKFFKLGEKLDKYNWGQKTEKSAILELMGAATTDEKVEIILDNLTEEQKGKLYAEVGNDISKIKDFIRDNVVAERWFLAGAVDVGMGIDLPIEVLYAWPEEVLGKAHVEQLGPVNDITGKHLDSKEELSLQMHTFDEQVRGEGEAYIGLKRGVSAQEFYAALLSGNVLPLLNKVKLDRNKTYVVPAYVPHAYGDVVVFETKAVTPQEDATGTISFFDRLKLLSWGYKNLDISAEELLKLNPGRASKDVLTMEEGDENTSGTRAYVRKWLNEAEKRGALNPIDMANLEYPSRTIAEQGNSRFDITGEIPKRFISGEYIVAEGEVMPSVDILSGRYHPLVVREGAVEVIFTETGKIYELKQGDEMLVYSDMGSYTVKSLKGVSSVYTQVKALPDVTVLPLVDNKAEEIGATGISGNEPSLVLKNWGSGVVDSVDALTIIDSAEKLPIIGEREHTIEVVEGEVKIVTPDDEEITSARAGEQVSMDATQEYRIVSTAKINAVVNVQYDKSEHENISYVVYEIVKKYLPAMRKNKVDLILPREIFAEGADSPNRPGTRSWFEDSINELLGWKSGEERYVEIKVYSDTVMEGMEKALSRSIRPGAIGVIGATKAQIERSSSDMAIRDTIQKKKVRIMSLPNIGKDDPLKTLPGEYSLTRDIALTGLMQAMLNQGTIIKATSLATDMEVLLSQLVGRRITRQELCYLLPYDEAEATIKLLDEAWEEKEFTVEELLKNLLALTLKPIRPYDARKQLEMRKKVMYSV